MKDKKVYEIPRNIWRCGGDKFDQHGSTCLLNDQGRMCCLGVMLKQDGFPKKWLEQSGTPVGLSLNLFNSKGPLRLRKKIRNHWHVRPAAQSHGENPRFMCSEIAGEMMDVNDDSSITQREREKRLKELAAKAGFGLKFTGRHRG